MRTTLFSTLLFALSCVLPQRASATFVNAYAAPYLCYPSGCLAQTGNQSYGASLGLDFDVLDPVVVRALGAFDGSENGLQDTLTVQIFDRTTFLPVTAAVTIDGGAGAPTFGYRFGDLPLAVVLPVGQYTVVAWGFSAGDPNGNFGCIGLVTSGCMPDAPMVVPSTNTNGGVIAFTGAARYGTLPGEYPSYVDGGPANRYLAGNFQYDSARIYLTPVDAPEAGTLVCVGLGLLAIGRRRLSGCRAA